MRLVLDTSVMVAAFRSRYGAARQLVRLVPLRRFDVVVTPALFLEYEAVLTRQEHMVVHKFSLLDIEAFFLYFATFTEKTRINTSIGLSYAIPKTKWCSKLLSMAKQMPS